MGCRSQGFHVSPTPVLSLSRPLSALHDWVGAKAWAVPRPRVLGARESGEERGAASVGIIFTGRVGRRGYIWGWGQAAWPERWIPIWLQGSGSPEREDPVWIIGTNSGCGFLLRCGARRVYKWRGFCRVPQFSALWELVMMLVRSGLHHFL